MEALIVLINERSGETCILKCSCQIYVRCFPSIGGEQEMYDMVLCFALPTQVAVDHLADWCCSICDFHQRLFCTTGRLARTRESHETHFLAFLGESFGELLTLR